MNKKSCDLKSVSPSHGTRFGVEQTGRPAYYRGATLRETLVARERLDNRPRLR